MPTNFVMCDVRNARLRENQSKQLLSGTSLRLNSTVRSVAISPGTFRQRGTYPAALLRTIYQADKFAALNKVCAGGFHFTEQAMGEVHAVKHMVRHTPLILNR